MSLYSLADLDSIDPREIEGIAPTLLPIGPALESEQLRPNVWHYERGEENTYHRQEQQEEFYLVLEGTVDVTVERDGERDVVTLTKHECMVVPPESWRQIEAVEESRMLVVGAPNVADDAVLKDASEPRS